MGAGASVYTNEDAKLTEEIKDASWRENINLSMLE